MPAIITHDAFGKDAIGHVSKLINLMSADARQAFLLGNQGPDPLFYLIADPRVDKQSRVGGLMHKARPAKLLESMIESLKMLARPERIIGEAYAAGFLCHYLLDSAMHPFVYAHEYAICDAGVEGLDRSDAQVVHAEIERDLDEMVLYTKQHETIETWRPYREILACSDASLDIIDKMYFYTNLWTYDRTLELDTFPRAVKSFRRVQRLLWSPDGRLTKAAAKIEQLYGPRRYSLLVAMAHRPRASVRSDFANRRHEEWTHPFSGVTTTESFWDIYEEANARVFDAVELICSGAFDADAATQLTGNLNFSGMEVDPQSVEASPAKAEEAK